MSSLGIVKMDTKGLDEVQKALDTKGHNTVCMRALNKTIKNVQVEGKKAIRGKYNIKAKDIILNITKASRMSLRAVISAAYKPLSLIKFGARQVKAGVRFMIKKGNKRVLKNAFIAQPKGKDWSRYGQTRQVTAPAEMVFIKGKGKKKLFGPKRKKQYGNYPIDKLSGPSLGAMLKDETVHDRMQTAANDAMEKNLYHELDYYLSKRGT